MLDIVIELLRVAILLGILAFFVVNDRGVQHGRRGYLYIKFGFLLIVFGAIMDVTDNFESLNWTVFAGDTPTQAVLEKVVGYLGGFVLLAYGFWLWLPTVRKMGEIQDTLEGCKLELEKDVMRRTAALEREVHKRRLAEAGLLAADERRVALYENAPVPIAHGIIGGSMVDRNSAFAAMLGYESPLEIVKAAAEKRDPFFIWPFREDVERMLELLKSQSCIHGFEGRMQRKDGSIILVRFNFTTLEDRDGDNYYFYAFAEDVTDQRQEADRLAESEKRLRIIMDSMPAALYLVDVETSLIADVNVAMLAMTGYGRDELVGHHCCSRLCPSDKGECPILDDGLDIDCRERAIRRKDGSELPVIKTVTRVTLGGRKYLLETFVDISEQKRLESLKRDVDRIVAHDLKAPVVSVINACNVLLMRDEGLDEETREILAVIESKGRKVLCMIGMSLIIYKMEAETFAYEPVVVDFLSVVRTVREELEESARQKGVATSVLVDEAEPGDGDVLEINGDLLLYETMLTNLLANAIEASPIGAPVTISITTTGPLEISIRNTGVVPEDVRDTFFDKYATSGKAAGTGIGTYSASLVARTVGGSISMETDDAEDLTVVTVELPQE